MSLKLLLVCPSRDWYTITLNFGTVIKATTASTVTIIASSRAVKPDCSRMTVNWLFFQFIASQQKKSRPPFGGRDFNTSKVLITQVRRALRSRLWDRVLPALRQR